MNNWREQLSYDQLYWKGSWQVAVWSGEFLIEHECPKTRKKLTYANYAYAHWEDLIANKNALTCDKCFESCSVEVFDKWLFLGAMGV